MGIKIETDLEYGKTYKDSVSGFKGKLVAITRFQYGCVRAGLQPEVKDEKLPSMEWFDEGSIASITPKENLSGGPTDSPKRNPDPSR